MTIDFIAPIFADKRFRSLLGSETDFQLELQVISLCAGLVAATRYLCDVGSISLPIDIIISQRSVYNFASSMAVNIDDIVNEVARAVSGGGTNPSRGIRQHLALLFCSVLSACRVGILICVIIAYWRFPVVRFPFLTDGILSRYRMLSRLYLSICYYLLRLGSI